MDLRYVLAGRRYRHPSSLAAIILNRTAHLWPLLAVIALLNLTAACGSSISGSSAEGDPDQSPQMRLLAPQTGDRLPGNTVQVEVEVSGLILDAQAIGLAKQPGRGHWHLYLDGQLHTATAETSVTLQQVTPGRHHLRVSLAENDHSPLTPPVEESVVIEVLGRAKPSTGGPELDY